MREQNGMSDQVDRENSGTREKALVPGNLSHTRANFLRIPDLPLCPCVLASVLMIVLMLARMLPRVAVQLLSRVERTKEGEKFW